MTVPPEPSLTTWAPSGDDLPFTEVEQEVFGSSEPGELTHVSGWRSAGWIAAYLHQNSEGFGWVRLDGCRTVADCVLATGTAMNLPVPGRTADVAAALGHLNLRDMVFDARTIAPELTVPLYAALSALSPQTRWWAAIHEPTPLPNHVPTSEVAEPIDIESLPATIEAGIWFPDSPRAQLNLPSALQRPDAPASLLRVDLFPILQSNPRRSLGAVVDSLVHSHNDLFSIATESQPDGIHASELFGLRLIAEYASDENVACLAGAAAIRCRLRVGQPTEAIERAEQVLARSNRADPAHRALVVWAEAVVQLHTGDNHRAQARFADAVALAEASRDKALLATMNRRWGDRLYARRLFNQASHRYRVALGLYRQQGDPEGACASLRGTADIAVAAGELLSAEALFDQAELNTTTAAEEVNRLLGRLTLSIAARQWDGVEQLKNRIRRIGIRTTTASAGLRRREADRALRNGDAVTAASEASIAEEQYEAAGEAAAAAGCIRLQADSAAAQGELNQALSLYRKAIDAQARCGDWLGLARTVEHLGHLDHSRGNLTEATEMMEISRDLMMMGGGS